MNHPAAAHVVLLATKYVWLAAAIWSGVVSGLAARHLCDVGHQVRLPVSVAERGFDIEQARCWVCRQHLCDNGGDGADIAGAVGKQHGVTVLQGKRHDREVNALFAPRG